MKFVLKFSVFDLKDLLINIELGTLSKKIMLENEYLLWKINILVQV